MALFKSDVRPIWSAEETWSLLVEPALEISVAAQVMRTVRMSGPTIRVPRVVSDPTAEWVAEGAEIPLGDPTFAEVEMTPSKLALISSVTIEAARDTTPAATQEIGRSLARALATALDKTLLTGATVGVAPNQVQIDGLETISSTPVPAGAGWEPGDFLDAQAAAEARGVRITSWLTSPATKRDVALMSMQLPDASALIGAAPSNNGSLNVFGSPVAVHPDVPAGVIYGIPRERCILGIRDAAEIDIDPSVFFSSWRLAVRAVLRAAFGWTDESAVVRLALGA